MDKYGLIGYPLKHSFSITYFNEKFQAEQIDAEYVNFEIPRIEDFMEVIDENPNLCGLNVTIPYKEQVIPYLDELDKDTAKIGAVNVIKIIRQPKCCTIMPPKNGPTAGAVAMISEATPIITPSLSSGTRARMILNISGKAMPVPTPWMMRPSSRREKVGAAPASTVPEINSRFAARNSAFIGKRRLR